MIHACPDGHKPRVHRVGIVGLENDFVAFSFSGAICVVHFHSFKLNIELVV